MNLADMGAGHFIFIPATLLIGIVIGWILGSRAATDAFRADQRRREERSRRDVARQARPDAPPDPAA